MDNQERQFWIDERIELYQPFFDNDWAGRTMQASSHTRFRGPVFDLVRNWQAASHAHALPWIMAKCLETTKSSILEDAVPSSIATIGAIRGVLVEKLRSKGENVRPTLERRLHSCVTEIDQEAQRSLQSAREYTLATTPTFWSAFVAERPFAVTLWSIERMCYGSLYYTYEWFLTECLRIALQKSDYRARGQKEVAADMKSAFGGAICESCWNCHEVSIARLVRHALAHNSGRVTKELRGCKHGFRVSSNEIQVMAEHTHSLFQTLKAKIDELLSCAVLLESFQNSEPDSN